MSSLLFHDGAIMTCLASSHSVCDFQRGRFSLYTQGHDTVHSQLSYSNLNSITQYIYILYIYILISQHSVHQGSVCQ